MSELELEYPVVNLEGDATDVEVIKHLFRYLVSALDFTVEKEMILGLLFS